MSIEKNLKNNEKLIFDFAKEINFSNLESFFSTPEIYRSYCTDKNKDIDYYHPEFDVYLLKTVNSPLFVTGPSNMEIEKILTDGKIFNIMFFRIWGNVLEHKDPTGKYMRYPVDKYHTLLMPIKIPNSENFHTFYGDKSIKLKKGKFMKWDVCNVKHHWDYNGDDGVFDLLHIDYTE
jgi:hypothetical protein